MEFILHQYIPSNSKATYVQEVYNIRPQKTETFQTRLSARGNLVEYPEEVRTPIVDMTEVKTHVDSVISDIIYQYMRMDVNNLYLNNCMDLA